MLLDGPIEPSLPELSTQSYIFQVSLLSSGFKAPTMAVSLRSGFKSERSLEIFRIMEDTVVYYSWLYSDNHDLKDLLNDDEFMTESQKCSSVMLRNDAQTTIEVVT